MSSSGAFNKLALILIINSFIQMHAADAESVVCGSVKDQVLNALSTVCNTTDSELICGRTMGLLEKKLENECKSISQTFCLEAKWGVYRQKLEKFGLANDTLLDKFLDSYSPVFMETCLKTKPIICSLFNQINLKKKCAKNLDFLAKILLDAEIGDETKLCVALPTTIVGVCKLVVKQGCEAITEEPVLERLVPECEKELGKLVCHTMAGEVFSIIADEYKDVKPTTISKPVPDCLYDNMKRV